MDGTVTVAVTVSLGVGGPWICYFSLSFFLAKGVRRAYWDGSTVISLFDYCDF